MSKYSAQINSAAALIARKGMAVAVHRITVGVYDPMNPENNVPESAESTATFAVSLPSNSSTLTILNLDDQALADPVVRKSFRFFLMSGKGMAFKPQTDDVIETPEGLCRILGITPLAPDMAGDILYNVGATLDVQLVIP